MSGMCEIKQSKKNIGKNAQFLTFFLDCLALDDGTNRLSRNVNMELQLYAAYNPKRALISSKWRRKPEIMLVLRFCFE